MPANGGPRAGGPKPAATWGNAATPALHNVHYRTSCSPPVSAPLVLVAGYWAARCAAATDYPSAARSFPTPWGLGVGGPVLDPNTLRTPGCKKLRQTRCRGASISGCPNNERSGGCSLSSPELVWGTPGVCHSCGVVTDHLWYVEVYSVVRNPDTGQDTTPAMRGSQGWLTVSRCLSPSCQSLGLWIGSPQQPQERQLVYPQPGSRTPPAEGLRPEEIELYEEAAAVAPTSRRAACALLRVLLEAFLNRHLDDAGHSAKDKNLVELIEAAVEHLDLSKALKDGLTAIRKRGNTAVHDPYGLTDATRAADLPWLFLAVDNLVDDLHVKPTTWADMAGA